MPSREIILLPMPRHMTFADGVTRVEASAAIEVRDTQLRPEAYSIEISRDAIRLAAGDAAGHFYARQTLAQLVRQAAGQPLPCLTIEDWPDFAARGVMIDISRDKVPTMATLFALVDDLASWKINQLQLYTEHTFAYRNHETVWRDASPMTPDEIRSLDEYCRARFIELVPNQNSFGHMERWLRHDRYRDLAECPDGSFYWAKHRPPATLNPLDPRSIALVRELHAELLPNFRSRRFNVGCDETMELGMGRSKVESDRVGRERIYLDFLKQIHQSVADNGRTMMFWGDIILHAPQLIDELPKDVIALEWGYEANHPFDEHCAAFAKSGVPHYVCPGTSSWCSIAGRTDNMLANLRSAAEAGVRHGAIGYLNTDWGDLGHWQYLPASYSGFAIGAAFAWCYEANRDLNFPAALDAHVFKDSAGVLGRLSMELGNVYRAQSDDKRHNSTLLFWLLRKDEDRPATLTNAVLLSKLGADSLAKAEHAIDTAVARLSNAQSDRADGDLIKAEFANAAALTRHACANGKSLIRGNGVLPLPADLLERHRVLWLARNRPGGLADSLHAFV